MTADTQATARFQKPLIALILVLSLLILVQKFYVYFQFSIHYTDEDQCVLWLAADELMKGHFHEPCFYGQDYNSCLEGWLAIPFLILGMDFHTAIPLVTLIISVLPFFLLAFYYFGRRQYLLSVAVLCCQLIFSLQYQLISVLPRGFITGVFCFGIAYFILLRGSRYRFFWFSLFGGFGFFLNETTVFLILPVLLEEWCKAFRNPKFYLQSALGIVLPLAYKVYSYLFYWVYHSEYNYGSKDKATWMKEHLVSSLETLNDWFFGQFWLWASIQLLLFAVFIYRHMLRSLAIWLLVFTLIIAFLGVERLQSGTGAMMFSRSRFFVFLPFLTAIQFSHIIRELNWNFRRQWFTAVAIFLPVAAVWLSHLIAIPETTHYEATRPYKGVSFMAVKDMFSKSLLYIEVCKKRGLDLIFIDVPEAEDVVLNLAIPLISRGEIRTFTPSYERRTWYYIDLLDDTPKRIAVLRHSGIFLDRPPLQKLKRRILLGGSDNMYEYELNKNIEYSVWFDFQHSLRLNSEKLKKQGKM